MQKLKVNFKDNFCKGLPDFLIAIFGVVFAFSFGITLLNVVFNRQVYSLVSLIIIPIIFLCLTLFFYVKSYIYVHFAFFERHCKKLLWISIGFIFIMQMIFGFLLRFDPIFDLEAVFKGGIALAEKGNFASYTSPTCHSDYFYIFPNNLGTLFLFGFIFKLANLIGFTDYFAVALIFNALLFSASVFFGFKLCRELLGVKSAIFMLFLILIFPPVYFMAPAFYTDSLSVLFPLLSVYLMLKGLNKKDNRLKLVLFSLSAITAAIGALIKMTVLISVIAIAIFLLLSKRFKCLLAYLLIAAAVVSAILSGFNSIVYSKYLDENKATAKNTPIYYWIDLAFHGEGKYDNNIFSLSVNTADPEKRKELLKEDIANGINELGITGTLDLFVNKSAICFGDGTLALSDFLDDNPQNQVLLHKFILYNGEYYGIYSHFSTAIFLSIQILMIFSAFQLRKNKKLLILLLSVFGIMLFLLFWEVNSRYITTFVPFIFIAAASVNNQCILKNR